MPKYLVLGRLDHDNVSYATGDIVGLTEGQAETLIAIGVILDRPISFEPAALQLPRDVFPTFVDLPATVAPAVEGEIVEEKLPTEPSVVREPIAPVVEVPATAAPIVDAEPPATKAKGKAKAEAPADASDADGKA